MIWGTDVNIQETKKRFKEFLETFVDDQSDEDVPPSGDIVQPFYMTRLEEVVRLSIDPGWAHSRFSILHAEKWEGQGDIKAHAKLSRFSEFNIENWEWPP